ncbi:ABC transporter permease [Sphingobacterium sp. UT-1RO-CII-1]|uniref:ABC transporter permease n=1 Tax=Sphingobacterium sp. UT-1RO-CII-1 TaxID=2995225 RepID=UPI00227A5E9C|nr:ABC transporter permease [Sphingobacterium sp. UT-1RO-CII-1]MCY4778087.1 ABC transporter permease [Sphingobacterium sp. UT-1RO-CII-1]
MFKNHIKLTLRHLWRNRVFTILNIVGLSIGISACWIIFQIVDYEFRFDQKHPDAERIYQFINREEREEKTADFAGISRALPITVKNEIAGVELVVPVYHKADLKASILNEDKEEIRVFEQPKYQVSVSESYFEMVPYQWIVGNVKTAFSSPKQVVLTKSRAELYFPNTPTEELLGKTIAYNDTSIMSISGVVADLDFPSSFNSQEFFVLTDKDWNNDWWGSFNSDDNLFVKLQENVVKENIINQINTINYGHRKEYIDKYGKQWYDLIPLADKHFTATFGANHPTTDHSVLYGLIGIALFILLLACINYINLSTAQLPNRAKEIGIHKTLGSSPSQLMRRFLGETFFITFFAVLLSLIVSSFALKMFADFIPEGMGSFQNYADLAVFLLVLILLITLLSGIYPAWLITRVQTANVLKGQVQNTNGQSRLTLRKGLIIFQFIIAQIFVIAAIIIGQQLHYTVNKNLGFDKEAIVTIDLPAKVLRNPAYVDKKFVLKDELVKNNSIASVALGDRPLDNSGYITSVYNISDTGKVEMKISVRFADEDLLDLYNFEVLAGTNLTKSDTIREFIVNESAVKAMGFSSPKDAIGVHLEMQRQSYPIVAVVKDFHVYDFKKEIPSTVFVNSKRQLNTVNIKLAASNPKHFQKTIGEIEQIWKSIYPNAAFVYKFYDESIAQLYESEYKMSKLISLATGITILISCLGLFGLATLTSTQRIKEIGIRKVLGASVVGIVQMLSKDFVKLVFIAAVIASPLAWWAMNKWLQDFTYRITIEWWMFVLAGVLALMVTLFTISFQAVRAAIANPVDSLRDE